MDDGQYGLPGDLRHLSAQPSVFPAAALAHRSMTSSSSSSHPGGNAGYHHQLPLTISSMSTTSFPLVSGGGLVVDSSHFPHNHHHYHHHGHHHHSNHSHDQFESAVWNSAVDGGSNINMNNSTMINGGDPASNNNCRWPRQETLTLLEIRSRLNPKFKDTNQKAPLWDEISRIMAEEHGYQRSGKKCKEKFENLYKYYKKTKEGKAGRQDGKHYRFFRQLEAIYGDQCANNIQSTSSFLEAQYLGGRNSSLLYDHLEANNSLVNRAPTYHESLSFSINSTEFETSSSDNNNNNNNEEDLSAIAFKSGTNSSRKMKGAAAMAKSSSSWKAKVEGFVDSEMRKIMATQETWMEKMLKTVIDKEEEQAAREDERRRLEAARVEREANEFWAREKAWVEARDVALMGAFKGLRGNNAYINKGLNSLIELPPFPQRMSSGRDHNSSSNYQRWSQEEISTLIGLRTSMETSLFEGNNSYNNNNNNESMNRDCVWEEIASKMVCLGFGRSANECRQKWESVSLYVTMTSECKKKRREDYHKTSGYYLEGQELELKQENDQVIRNNNNNINNYSNNNNNNNNNNSNSNNNVMGLQLMDERLNSPSSSNVGSTSQMHPNNFFQLLFGEGENLWEKYGTLKLGKR